MTDSRMFYKPVVRDNCDDRNVPPSAPSSAASPPPAHAPPAHPPPALPAAAPGNAAAAAAAAASNADTAVAVSAAAVPEAAVPAAADSAAGASATNLSVATLPEPADGKDLSTLAMDMVDTDVNFKAMLAPVNHDFINKLPYAENGTLSKYFLSVAIGWLLNELDKLGAHNTELQGKIELMQENINSKDLVIKSQAALIEVIKERSAAASAAPAASAASKTTTKGKGIATQPKPNALPNGEKSGQETTDSDGSVGANKDSKGASKYTSKKQKFNLTHIVIYLAVLVNDVFNFHELKPQINCIFRADTDKDGNESKQVYVAEKLTKALDTEETMKKIFLITAWLRTMIAEADTLEKDSALLSKLEDFKVNTIEESAVDAEDGTQLQYIEVKDKLLASLLIVLLTTKKTVKPEKRDTDAGIGMCFVAAVLNSVHPSTWKRQDQGTYKLPTMPEEVTKLNADVDFNGMPRITLKFSKEPYVASPDQFGGEKIFVLKKIYDEMKEQVLKPKANISGYVMPGLLLTEPKERELWTLLRNVDKDQKFESSADIPTVVTKIGNERYFGNAETLMGVDGAGAANSNTFTAHSGGGFGFGTKQIAGNAGMQTDEVLVGQKRKESEDTDGAAPTEDGAASPGRRRTRWDIPPADDAVEAAAAAAAAARDAV